MKLFSIQGRYIIICGPDTRLNIQTYDEAISKNLTVGITDKEF